MKKILSLGILLLITFAWLFNHKFSIIPAFTQKDTFIVGTVSGYAPFVSINQDGVYEGFDIDFANELAKRLNKKLILKDLGCMPSLFIALEQGSINAIIWALSITPERLKKVAMIKYRGQNTTAYPLVFWNKIPPKVSSLHDLSGKTICVEFGSSQETALDRYPNVIKKPIATVTDALLEIQYAKADAAFVEPAIAKKMREKFSEIKLLNVPLQPEDQVFGMGIAMKKIMISLRM